eukprot:m.35158 g.35158  ORF g.35158 m.35158 type:complete len:362 (+) comp32072_c0_seq2:1453-2538(+)
MKKPETGVLLEYITEIEVLRGIANGLNYLHSRKEPIIHRDLKPSNVLIWVSPEGEALAKISDFGLAKELKEGKADATQTNLGGSNGWMPPEVFALKINCAFDIFSFGCIIYYVLTKGKHPFDEEQRLPCESKQRFGNAHTRILTGVPPIFTALEDVIKESISLTEEQVKRIGNPAAALCLIEAMLTCKEKRLSSCCVKSHCYFMKMIHHVNFYQAFGNYKDVYYSNEGKENAAKKEIKENLAKHDRKVLGSCWWSDTLKLLGAKGEFLKKAKNVCKSSAEKNKLPVFARYLRNQICHSSNADSIKEFYESDETFAVKLIRGFPHLLPTFWEVSKTLVTKDFEKFHCLHALTDLREHSKDED